MTNAELIKRIQDALGTADTGEALIEVARNAYRAKIEILKIAILLDKAQQDAIAIVCE
jgi:hypothetical protein